MILLHSRLYSTLLCSAPPAILLPLCVSLVTHFPLHCCGHATSESIGPPEHERRNADNTTNKNNTEEERITTTTREAGLEETRRVEKGRGDQTGQRRKKARHIE